MFTVADAQRLHQFLQEPSGQNLIEELRKRKPSVIKINGPASDMGTLDQIAIRGAYAQCWDEMIETIIAMSAERNEQSDGLEG